MLFRSLWQQARKRYETVPDVTQAELANELGVSRQCVHKHVTKEGWLKFTGVDVKPPTGRDVDIYRGIELGKRSDANVARIIDTYALTGSKAMACRQVGIDDKTLYNWCQELPELSLTLTAARENHLIGQYRKIADAKDWKAAKEILSRAPETREQWGETHDKGPTIILNIHRDEIVIES